MGSNLLVMEGLVFGIGLIVLVALSWYFAADSRPALGDGWSERRQRWYPGS